MMKKNQTENNAVDQLMRKALANAEKETSANWETLQLQLVKIQKHKRNRMIIWWTSATAAACLLCIGMFWFMWSHPEPKSITAVDIAPEPVPALTHTPQKAAKPLVLPTHPSPAQLPNDAHTPNTDIKVIANNDGKHIKPKKQKNASSLPVHETAVATDIKHRPTDTIALLAKNQTETTLPQNAPQDSVMEDLYKADLPIPLQKDINTASIAEYATVLIIKEPSNTKPNKTPLFKKVQKSIYQAQMLLSDSSISELKWEVNKRLVAWVNNNR